MLHKKALNDTSPVTILLIGSKVETVNSFEKYLNESKDFVFVGSLTTGHEGIEKVPQLLPDVVFIDSSTPDMLSSEVISELKKLVPHCKIVLMSGSNDPMLIREGLLAGADSYLTRPVDMEGLYHTIRVTSEQN